MPRIARLIVDHSRKILAATALLSLLAVAMLFRMDFNADVSSFLLEGNETGEEFAALQEKYDAADPINVVASLPQGRSFAEPDLLNDLVALRDSLAAEDGVAAVASVVPETNPLTGQPLTAEMIAAIPPALAAQLLDQSPVGSLLVSEDQQIGRAHV